MTTSAIFLDFSRRKLRQQAERVGICVAELSEEQVWMRANESSNAVGNLVLHLCGNVRQWIVAGVGGGEDVRDRAAEFAATRGAELNAQLAATVEEACAVLVALDEARLLERVRIQGYDVTVLEAVYHVVEHFSGHAGQIIQMTKALTNRPLTFYVHLASQHAQRTP